MRVLTLIMAGGQGRNLSCLCETRGKPALPVGGMYRIVDFPLSNAVNSGLNRIAVLTQYQAQPLMDHVGAGEPWGLAQPGKNGAAGGLEVWLAGVERTGQEKYIGSADALYQNSRYIAATGCDRVLVLAGDQVYRQDYQGMLRFMQETGADVVISSMQVTEGEAHRFGQLTLDPDRRIVDFNEKVNPPVSRDVSLGIYLFRTECLLMRAAEDAFDPDSTHDFGRDLLPRMVQRDRVYAYPYSGYWVDVGGVAAYWQTNLDLLAPAPSLNLDDPAWKFQTRAAQQLPALVQPTGTVQNSLISPGCVIGGEVIHSVISPGVRVEAGAVVRDSVVMQDTVIRAGARVERCVIDQDVLVGANAALGADLGDQPNQEEPESLRSGITVVGMGARVPAGAAVGRNCRIDVGVQEEDFMDKQVPSGGTVKRKS